MKFMVFRFYNFYRALDYSKNSNEFEASKFCLHYLEHDRWSQIQRHDVRVSRMSNFLQALSAKS